MSDKQNDERLREKVYLILGEVANWGQEFTNDDEPIEAKVCAGGTLPVRVGVDTIMALIGRDRENQHLIAMERSESLCGCRMCEHHSSAYAVAKRRAGKGSKDD